MIAYIQRNKEWIFSGIGVAILVAVFTFVAPLFHQRNVSGLSADARLSQSPPEATATHQLTPESIMDELGAARPLQRSALEKTFIGVPVAWKLKFSDANVRDDGASLIFYSPGDERLHPPVVCKVSTDRATELRLLERGSLVQIHGKIESIELNFIYLSDAVITPTQ